ncbi:MAG: efflux RND transporter periplasmic adaptor subunit [Rhodospirillaceae bacterium]
MRRSFFLGLCVIVAAAFLWGRPLLSLLSLQKPETMGAPAASEHPVERGAKNANERDNGNGGGAEKRPVPVTVAATRRKDVPIYLDGLGTVQAGNQVTIRSRVDGELVQIAFKEGQEVRAGDLLARLDSRSLQAQLDQVLAAKAKDEAQLELARLDLQRYIGLGNRVPGQTVDTARAQVKQLEATVRVDQAQIDNARTLLSYTVITSPIAGRTGIQQIDVGNLIHANDAGGLVTVTQLQPVSVLFTLPQQNLQVINEELRRQGKLSVLVSGSGGRSAAPETGELVLVDNQIDQTTGTIRLKANFPNTERHLWPGGFVTVRLLLTTRQGGLVIPGQAVQRGPKGAYVFLVKPDKTVEMRPVTVARIENDEALIDSGLEAGDSVVTDGMARLSPGARVKTGDAEKRS